MAVEDDSLLQEMLLDYLLLAFSDESDLDKAVARANFSIKQWGGFGNKAAVRDNYQRLIDAFDSAEELPLLAFAAVCAHPSNERSGAIRENFLGAIQSDGVELFEILNDARIKDDWVIEAYHPVQRAVLEQRKTWTSHRPGMQKLTKLLAIYEVVTNAESHGQDFITPFVQAIVSRGNLQEHDTDDMESVLSKLLRKAGLASAQLAIPSPNQPAIEHVLIHVEESLSPSAKPRWNVAAHHWLSNGAQHLLLETPSAITEAEIPNYLSQLRSVLDEGGLNVDHVMMHFFVPLDMLAKPIDQWTFPIAPGENYPCGAEYRVVVRLSDVIDGRLERLKSRWQHLKEADQFQDAKHFLYLERQRDFKRAYKDFRDLHQLQCVLVDAAISAEEDLKAIHCLAAAFCAGIPVVIWGRDPATVGELRQVAKTWCSVPRSQWPDQVWKCRSQAVENPASLGNHVTLMFEDPDRTLPAKTRLKAARS